MYSSFCWCYPCRTIFSEWERKKESGGSAGSPQAEAVHMKSYIETKLQEAKKEMQDEITAGVSGKILWEDELQGTPTKKKRQAIEDKEKKRKEKDRKKRKHRETSASGSSESKRSSSRNSDGCERQSMRSGPGQRAHQKARFWTVSEVM